MTRNLSRLQMNIIGLLVAGKTRKEISQELECSLNTVARVKADPELNQIYYQQCNEQIENLVPLAIKRLETLIKDDKQQGAVQIACIREILDRSHLKELLEKKTSNIELVIKYE